MNRNDLLAMSLGDIVVKVPAAWEILDGISNDFSYSAHHTLEDWSKELGKDAEKIADDAGVLRPDWAGEVPPLDQPWEGLGTPRMRAANAGAAPPQLVARQILIPTESLWRPAAA